VKMIKAHEIPPAIDWLKSYSLYSKQLEPYHQEHVAADFLTLRDEAMAILQRENELLEIVQLVGADSLPAADRLLLFGAKMIREDFLQQDAFDDVDSYCSGEKQYQMLKVILTFYNQAREALDAGVDMAELTSNPLIEDIAKMKYLEHKKFMKASEDYFKQIEETLTKRASQKTGGEGKEEPKSQDKAGKGGDRK